MDIGQRISEIRKQKGITFRYLSEESGISTKNIGNIEKGKTDPQISTVKRILCVLGYHLEIIEKAIE